MNPTVVIWILAVVVAVLVGREVGKWLFGENAKLMQKKRAAQVLAGKLRDNGLKLLPTLLEDFAVGDVQDMVEKIQDVAKLVESGSDAIEKELEATYENVLAKKLATPEGMALIKAKIADIEGPCHPGRRRPGSCCPGRPCGSCHARQVVSNTPAAPLPVSGDVHLGPVGNGSVLRSYAGPILRRLPERWREPPENRRTLR